MNKENHPPSEHLPRIVQKKGDKSAKHVEKEFFLKTYNFFPFFDKEQHDNDGQATFVSDELRNSLINNNLDKWKRCYDKVLTLGGLFLPRG